MTREDGYPLLSGKISNMSEWYWQCRGQDWCISSQNYHKIFFCTVFVQIPCRVQSKICLRVVNKSYFMLSKSVVTYPSSQWYSMESWWLNYRNAIHKLQVCILTNLQMSQKLAGVGQHKHGRSQPSDLSTDGEQTRGAYYNILSQISLISIKKVGIHPNFCMEIRES